jgi:hypothetical protein
MKSWPTATGKVTAAEISTHYGMGYSSLRYKTDVSYNFDLDGKTYTGSTAFTDMSSRSTAMQVVDRYSPGQLVPVKYDLHNPLQSTLNPGGTAKDHWKWIFVSGGGLLLIIVQRILMRRRGLSEEAA